MPKMRAYIVTEVVEYRVMAEDEDHAEMIITEAADRDKYCIGVPDRYAELDDDQTTPVHNGPQTDSASAS